MLRPGPHPLFPGTPRHSSEMATCLRPGFGCRGDMREVIQPEVGQRGVPALELLDHDGVATTFEDRHAMRHTHRGGIERAGRRQRLPNSPIPAILLRRQPVQAPE